MAIDPAYAAVPALGLMAGCIGSSRVLRLTNSEKVPAVLWTMLVAISGSGKSPPLHAMASMIDELEYEINYGDGFNVREPEFVCMVQKSTVEKMGDLLSEQPRGLLLVRDELAGWIKDFDSYRKGSDEQFWLAMHSGEPYSMATKQDGILKGRGHVSVTGNTQPMTLLELMKPQLIASGLFPRLLVSMPPRQVPKNTGKEVSQEAHEQMKAMFRHLLHLPAGLDDEPIELTLGVDAKAKYDQLCLDIERRQEEILHDDERLGEVSALSKLKHASLRLALVLHLADPKNGNRVGHLTMGAAITLAKWFQGEATLLYEWVAEKQKANANNGKRTRTILEVVKSLEERGERPSPRLISQQTGWNKKQIEQYAEYYADRGQLFYCVSKTGKRCWFQSYNPEAESFLPDET